MAKFLKKRESGFGDVGSEFLLVLGAIFVSEMVDVFISENGKK